jgi:hypothetical protein
MATRPSAAAASGNGEKRGPPRQLSQNIHEGLATQLPLAAGVARALNELIE